MSIVVEIAKRPRQERTTPVKIRLIQVPYDLGQENVGMGKAPQRYLQAGAEELLSNQGFTVTVERIQREGPFQD
ncbi:MAG TPA: hypothetical protein VFN35_22865, partial [Ktedonobacteraceae bacterium]|nr:hypothetical protein [Ktedonobacteraceae bacterium]